MKTPFKIMSDCYSQAFKIVSIVSPEASNDAKTIAASNLAIGLFSYEAESLATFGENATDAEIGEIS